MRIEVFSTSNDRAELKLRITYTKKEWERIKNYYESSPAFRKGRTTNLFGTGQQHDAYLLSGMHQLLSELSEDVKEEVRKRERVDIDLIDDINEPLIYFDDDGVLILNIAVFRVIPELRGDSYVLELTLPKSVMYIEGFRFYRFVVKHLIRTLELAAKGEKYKIIYKVEVVKE